MLKKCYINSDLILDFNSLLFSILKKQNPELNLNVSEVQENPLKFQESLTSIEQYFKILKPQIGAIETIQFLKSQNIEVILYHEYFELFNKYLPKFNIVKFQQISQQYSLTIDPRIAFCEQLNLNNQQVVLLKNHKLKDNQYWEEQLINKKFHFANSWEEFDWKLFQIQGNPIFSPQQFKVNEIPNSETLYWDQVIQLNPVELKSIVIHGKNRGGTMLGIPTANLQITEDIKKLTNNLLPGVYAGISYLKQIKYKSVLSIGYNPYFLDTPLTIEVNLYNTFENDFYGEELQLIITHFIRPESDFRNFDHLIKAISNDKIIANKLN